MRRDWFDGTSAVIPIYGRCTARKKWVAKLLGLPVDSCPRVLDERHIRSSRS